MLLRVRCKYPCQLKGADGWLLSRRADSLYPAISRQASTAANEVLRQGRKAAFQIAEPRQALSLGHLIHANLLEDAMPGVISGISVHERIKLAKILAITVLQYHDTPWLSQLWTSEDIFFFGTQRKSSVLALPDISAPHLNAKVTSQQSQRLSTSTVARNPFLFSLGAVMIELA